MKVSQREIEKTGIFFIEQDGRTVGKMTYSRADNNTIVIEHTEVDDELKGKGAGKQLVAAAVEWARNNNMKIKPMCSFASGVFERVSEYRDVL